MIAFLFLLAGCCSLCASLIALCIYVHPVAALLALCALIVGAGEYFDYMGD